MNVAGGGLRRLHRYEDDDGWDIVVSFLQVYKLRRPCMKHPQTLISQEPVIGGSPYYETYDRLVALIPVFDLILFVVPSIPQSETWRQHPLKV